VSAEIRRFVALPARYRPAIRMPSDLYMMFAAAYRKAAPSWPRRMQPFRTSRTRKGHDMDKDELAAWALKNGWQIIAGCPSLTKPSRPQEAIVRIVLKATVASLEVKKPAGKWEKVAGQSYAKIHADPDTGLPMDFGLDTIPGFTSLMRENKDRLAFAGMTGPIKK
jgi:hypothetical protein